MKNLKYNIYNDDCFKILKNIPSESVDLVLIDPPYNIKKADWDSWDSVSQYVEFMGKAFKEYERILKPTGQMFYFHNDFLQIVELQNFLNKNTNFHFKQFITWNKISPDYHNKSYMKLRLLVKGNRNFYGGFTEYGFHYDKIKKPLYFWDEVHNSNLSYPNIKKYLNEELKKSGYKMKDLLNLSKTVKGKTCFSIGHYFKDIQWILPTEYIYTNVLQKTGYFNKPYNELVEEYNKYREEYIVDMEKFNAKYHPTFNLNDNYLLNGNVWTFAPPKNRYNHPTCKPTDLIEHIIKATTKEGDLVLDSFMGSGTTGVASINNNRNFIGIELDPSYYNIAKLRIEESMKNIK